MSSAVRAPVAWTTGTSLSATNLNKLAAGMVGYADNTTGSASITSVYEVASLTGIPVRSGFLYRITADFGDFFTMSAVGLVECRLFIDGDLRSTKSFSCISDMVGAAIPAPTIVRIWPTSSSATLSLSMQVQIGTGTPTVAMQASADAPALLLIEEIGPSS